MTYTTAHGNARSLTQWVRPGIKPTSSWILYWVLITLTYLCRVLNLVSHNGNSPTFLIWHVIMCFLKLQGPPIFCLCISLYPFQTSLTNPTCIFQLLPGLYPGFLKASQDSAWPTFSSTSSPPHSQLICFSLQIPYWVNKQFSYFLPELRARGEEVKVFFQIRFWSKYLTLICFSIVPLGLERILHNSESLWKNGYTLNILPLTIYLFDAKQINQKQTFCFCITHLK